MKTKISSNLSGNEVYFTNSLTIYYSTAEHAAYESSLQEGI
jgi:hypothetical protein